MNCCADEIERNERTCLPPPVFPKPKPNKKILRYLAVAAALTSSAIAAPKTILVDAQVVEMTTNDDALPKDLSRLAERKGVDVLTFPRQKTPSGKAAKLSAVHELAIPHKALLRSGSC